MGLGPGEVIRRGEPGGDFPQIKQRFRRGLPAPRAVGRDLFKKLAGGSKLVEGKSGAGAAKRSLFELKPGSGGIDGRIEVPQGCLGLSVFRASSPNPT